MNLSFYQAECGDAARIRYIGTDGKPHNILIDGGHGRTYGHVLAKEIKAIKKAGELVDLWVVSHIHDDHIGGVLAYVDAVKSGAVADIINAWYYNHARAITATTLAKAAFTIDTKSIAQGDELTQYLVGQNKLPPLDITNLLPTTNLFGLQATILSPSEKDLARLRKKYPAKSNNALQRLEPAGTDDEKGAAMYDYQLKVGDFNLNRFAADKSVENGSGIAMLTEFGGSKILWLADTFPATVVAALRALGYSKSNPIICDYVKVTHHGSKGNNSNELYEMIRCSNYIMSVNGNNIYRLPTKECMVRIIRCATRPATQYQFYFTYNNKTLRNIFKVDGDSVFTDYNFRVHYMGKGKKMLLF